MPTLVGRGWVGGVSLTYVGMHNSGVTKHPAPHPYCLAGGGGGYLLRRYTNKGDTMIHNILINMQTGVLNYGFLLVFLAWPVGQVMWGLKDADKRRAAKIAASTK